MSLGSPQRRQTDGLGGGIELTLVRGGAPPGLGLISDEPAKVQLPMDCAGALSEYPRKIFNEQASLAVENECLAYENARLAWENAMLQQQQLAGQQGWWTPADWSASMDPWAPGQAGFQPGATVVFDCLKNATELNGQAAVLERWDADSGRWVVRLPSGQDKFAKPENLVLVYSWPMCCPDMPRSGSFSTGEGQRSGRTKKASGTGRKTPATSSFGSESTATGTGTVRSSFSSFAGDDGFEVGCQEETGPKTTVMMRNIPNDYTRDMLLKLLNDEGFKGSYDLVYLPIDYTSKVGFGYAFINLISCNEAARFRKHFEGFAAWDVVSQKVCEVCWSSVLQGVQAHVDRYRNSPVMHEAVPDEFKPVLFLRGERVPFPAPTKSVRAPRARRKESK